MKTVQCGALSLGCLPQLVEQEQGFEATKAKMLQNRGRSCCTSRLNGGRFKIFMKPEERMGLVSFSSFSGSSFMLGSLHFNHGWPDRFRLVGFVSSSPSIASTDSLYLPPMKKSWRGRKLMISSAKFENGEQAKASGIQGLPLSIPGGISVECWGRIYQGDGEEKYYNRKSASQHPYPVGYVSKKVYKGSIFEQTIQAGTDGPIFTVKVGEKCFTANNVNRAWAFACEHFQPGSKHRIPAHRYYGFESEDVLKRLRRMQVELSQEKHTSKMLQHSIAEVPPEHTQFGTLEEQRRAAESSETFVAKEQNASNEATHLKKIEITGDLLKNKEIPSDGRLNKIDKVSHQQAGTLLNDDLFKKMVRLRSKLLTDNYSQKENLAGVMNYVAPFVTPEFGRSILTSFQADSEVNSRTCYSDNSHFAATGLTTTCPQSENESGDSREFLNGASLDEKSLENTMDGMDDVNDISGGSKQSDAAPSHLRKSILWEGSLLQSITKNSKCSSALNELLSHWRKADMLAGEAVLSSDGGTSVHSVSNTIEIDNESRNSRETSYLNEAVVFEEIRELFATKKVKEAISFFKSQETGMPSLVALAEKLFPCRMDDWQTRALQHLNEGDSVLLCAPHGAGKSVVAECCLYQSILQEKQAIFVTPFSGLAHQQFLAFQKIFGKSRVGGAWEATKVQLRAQIRIITLEVLVKELREHFDVKRQKKTTFLDSLNIVIMDKYFEAVDGGLGSLWEEATMLMHPEVRLLALTLPAANADHLSSWLSHIHKPCKLVFLSTQASDVDTVEPISQAGREFSSYFRPSYSLLVNLLAKCDSVKVKEILERNFSGFIAKRMAMEDVEYARIEKEETRCNLLLEKCEKELLKELRKENQQKLDGAAVFTRVAVREKGGNCPHPGVMFAILPGLHEHHYMVLCADNKFRLVPAGALEHIYVEEPPLDFSAQMATGSTLTQPTLPSRRSWLPDPTVNAGYMANGTLQSAQLLEVLHHSLVKPHESNEKGHTFMKSIEENLSNLRKRKELLSRHSRTINNGELQEGKIWEEAQKKISALDKAGALSQRTSTNKMKLNPLAKLVSGLHYLKNELWVSLVLTSSFVKQLTPPELASVCSTLVFDAETLDKSSKDKFDSSYELPKRVQEILEKIEALREQVASMEGSPTHTLAFDATPAALVYAWTRGNACTYRSNSVKGDSTYSVLQSTLRLLQQIDMTCTESIKRRHSESLSVLAQISRRAAYLLNRIFDNVSGKS